MATNFEFYKDEILTKVSPFYKTKCIVHSFKLALGEKYGEDCDCANYSCAEGVQELIEWLYAEHIEPPKLTKRERAFCEVLETGWIARDKDRSMCWFPADAEVEKGQRMWHGKKFVNISSIGLSFALIKWEDEKPWSVEDLLKLEVMEVQEDA